MFFLAIIYLALPVFILLFSLFSLPFTICSTVALSVLVIDYHRQLSITGQTPIPSWHKSYPLLVITVSLVAIGVVNPYLHWDWDKSFGIFNLLRDAQFPPFFTRLDGEPRLLRYYLAWYIVPSLSARLFGDFLLSPVLFLSTAFGISLALLMAFADLRRARDFFIVAIVFFLFSGLDIVGRWITGKGGGSQFDLYQWYVDWGSISFPLLGTSMHPQHAIPAWLAVSMLLTERRLTLRYSVVIGAFVLMWSPLVAIGLIPLYAWSAIKEGPKIIFTPANVIAAPLIALPLILYLTQGTAVIPFSFIWEVINGFSELLMFWLVEFLVIALAIYYTYRADNQLLLLSVISLLGLSLFSYGVINDFLMRTSMPYIFILAILAAKAVVVSRGIPRALLIICLSIGAIPVAISLFNGMTYQYRIDKSVSFGKTTVVNESGFQHQHSIALDDQRTLLGVPLMRSHD